MTGVFFTVKSFLFEKRIPDKKKTVGQTDGLWVSNTIHIRCIVLCNDLLICFVI